MGIGGDLDATNVVHDSAVCVVRWCYTKYFNRAVKITSIGHDHMDLLGDTLEVACLGFCGHGNLLSPLLHTNQE